MTNFSVERFKEMANVGGLRPHLFRVRIEGSEQASYLIHAAYMRKKGADETLILDVFMDDNADVWDFFQELSTNATQVEVVVDFYRPDGTLAFDLVYDAPFIVEKIEGPALNWQQPDQFLEKYGIETNNNNSILSYTVTLKTVL